MIPATDFKLSTDGRTAMWLPTDGETLVYLSTHQGPDG